MDAAKEESEAADLRPRRSRRGVAGETPWASAPRARASRAPAAAPAQLKELEKRQKSRGTRTQRDALDRALVDLAAFYRDVLVVQLGTGSDLVHGDLGEQAAAIARATSPEATLARIDAVLACRTAVDAAVPPLLAVEALALALRSA